jgi:putative addiction module component (TIGR02574 family)
MAMTFQKLRTEALRLPEDSRAELAENLLESLDDGMDPAVQKAWLEEAERRRQEILRGEVETIPAEVVFASLRSSLE